MGESNEVTKEITNEMAMKMLGEFAQRCYNQGCIDTLTGFLIGGAIVVGATLIGSVCIDWVNSRKAARMEELIDN